MQMRAPLYREAKWWGVAAGWWTLNGVASAMHSRFIMEQRGDPVSWEYALRTALATAWLWVPLTVFALWSAERFPLERGRWRRHLPVHLAAGAAVVLLRAGAVMVANGWIGWYAELPAFGHVLFTSLANNLFFYWLLVGVGHALHYARRARERETQLVRAQLDALKMQLQPHFLFNTLNTIAASVHSDPDTAERMIARLSDLLRRSLASAGRHEVSLDEELAFLEPYLEIQQARFEDRLRVRWEIAPEARGARVPHLLLQPLVENAVRHGIAPRSVPGTVEIRAERRDGELQIRVRDDGVGLGAPGASRAGVGIANTRARLQQLYGDRHRFVLEPAPGGGAQATLSLPYRPALVAEGVP